MAEANGWALARGLTQGCIYLYGLFENIKDLPEDVKLLIAEVEILLNVSKSIEAQLKAAVLGGVSPEADFRPALEQCVHTITSLKNEVAEDIARYRLKGFVSKQNESMEKWLFQIEQTKRQAQIVLLKLGL